VAKATTGDGTVSDVRFARGYVLAHPSDCDPPHGLDMTEGGRDWLKVRHLEQCFREWGFDPGEPALVGYPLNGRIQLLSGTHRHLAAMNINMMLPVRIILRSEWEAAWGTPEGAHMCRDIRVSDLENLEVGQSTTPPALADRVDLTRDLY